MVASEAGKAAKATAAMVATTAGATITATETTDHPGEMTVITMTIGEMEAVRTDPLGIEEDETRGIMPLHIKPTRPRSVYNSNYGGRAPPIPQTV